jgi:adenosylcobinamide kinase / adenosylcobinamide-phosphate guanylyltransferase
MKKTTTNPKLILITGGVRSGKSSFAETLAGKISKNVAFIATAQPLDKEMADRIEKHRADRPANWKTYEEPFNVGEIVSSIGKEVEVIIIDCLTLLVSNLMQDYQEGSLNKKLHGKIIKEINEIVRESLKGNATVIIVSNEVGLGLVPTNSMGRFYRDILGYANQIIANNAEQVYLLVVGIPLLIKGNSDETYF